MKEGNSSVGQVARGAGVNMLGEVIGAVGAPLLYAVISWVLGPKILGTYVLVTYYIALFLRLAILGFDRGVLRHIPISHSAKDPKSAAASTLGTALRWTGALSVLIAAVVFFFPDVFLAIGRDNAAVDAKWWLAVLVLALPGQALTKVALFAIRGLSNMWAFVVVQNLVAPISLTVFSLAPLLFGMGPRSLVFGFLGSSYLSMFVAFVLLGRFFSELSFGGVLSSIRDTKLVNFSYPQGISETLVFLLVRVDVIMIGLFFPDKPELVAYYAIASTIAGVVKKVRFAFDTSFSPVFSELHARGDLAEMKAQYRKVGQWITTLFVLVSGALILSSRFILYIYGPQYVDYWLIVPILIIGRIFNSAGGPAQAALLMSGRSKLEFANVLMTNLINIGLNYILIQRYGIYGAAIGTTTALTAINLARIGEIAKLVRVWVDGKKALMLLFTGLVAGVPGWLVISYVSSSVFVSLGMGILYVLIYPALLMALGGREDVLAVWRFITRKKKSKQVKEHS